MKKKLLLICSILTLVPGFFGANAFAQEVRGEIQGTVRDPQGAVIPSVTITITGTGVGFTRVATTDEQGFYRMREIPPGIFTVAVAPTAGFAGQTKENVRVLIGNTSTVDFDLAIGTGTAVVDVQAEGGAATVDVTETRVHATGNRDAAERHDVFQFITHHRFDARRAAFGSVSGQAALARRAAYRRTPDTERAVRLTTACLQICRIWFWQMALRFSRARLTRI